jgi:hypothetical protein
MGAHQLRKSLLAELRFGAKRKCVAAAIRRNPSSLSGASRHLHAAQPTLHCAMVLMLAPNRDDQHVNMKQLSHGGNCSIALRISSREIVRPTESNVHRGQADLVSEADSSI